MNAASGRPGHRELQQFHRTLKRDQAHEPDGEVVFARSASKIASHYLRALREMLEIAFDKAAAEPTFKQLGFRAG